MAQRKTFKVADFKSRANYFLANSHDDKKEQRLAYATMVEGVLMDTGNYQGFGYLNADDMKGSENGTSVGINFTTATDSAQAYKERFEDTDDSRRFYF